MNIMTVGEIYFRVSVPLGGEYTVFKVEGNYAYLGRYGGSEAAMIDLYMPNGYSNEWVKKRSEALEIYADKRINDAKLLLKMALEYKGRGE